MNGKTKVTINFEHEYNETNIIYIRDTFGAMVQKEINENKLPYTLELIKNDSLKSISYFIKSNSNEPEFKRVLRLGITGMVFCDTNLPSKHYKIIHDCAERVSTYLKDRIILWDNEIYAIQEDINNHLFLGESLKLSTMNQYIEYNQESISNKEMVNFNDKEIEMMCKLKEIKDKISYHEKIINDPNTSPTLLHISTISLPILLENKLTIEDYINLIQKLRF